MYMGYKTIKISEEFHAELKKHCIDRNLKLNAFCEMLIQSGFLYEKEYKLDHPKLRNKGGKVLITDSPIPKEESQ